MCTWCVGLRFARGVFDHFFGFGFFLGPSRIPARPLAGAPRRTRPALERHIAPMSFGRTGGAGRKLLSWLVLKNNIGRNQLASIEINSEVNGHRLFGLLSGEGETTVILDAGLGGTSEDWAKVQPEVANFSKVFRSQTAFACPKHGGVCTDSAYPIIINIWHY